uniref:Phage protein (ACLAME 827) n=1 Tax=uncultured Armatimonadetes bacterium TaxID=157466 RepID=A0A6J4JQJ8_9BACT|nr:Phage protein (ACLAME 827) [uncultured Armatimonadetes bacterium]
METTERQVKLLVLENGKCPFAAWYTGIKDTLTRARIAARIARVQAGNPGDSKSVGEGVHELRLDFGPGYRVYFALIGDTIVVLLVGGDKATQEDDIERAQTLWKENRANAERFQRDFGG